VFPSPDRIAVSPQRASAATQIRSRKQPRTRRLRRQQPRWETLCPELGSLQAPAPKAALTQNGGVSPPLCKKAAGRRLSPRPVPCTDPAGKGLATQWVTMLVDQRRSGWEKHHGAKTTSQHSPVAQPLKSSLSTGRQDWTRQGPSGGREVSGRMKTFETLIHTQGMQSKRSTLSSLPSPLPYHLPPQNSGWRKALPCSSPALPNTAPVPARSKTRAVLTKH